MRIDCIICGKKNLDKDTVGINKKMLGEALTISTAWIVWQITWVVQSKNSWTKLKSSRKKAVSCLCEVRKCEAVYLRR